VRAAAFGAPIGGNGNNSGAQWRTLGPFANQSSAYPHPLGPAPAQNCGTVCSWSCRPACRRAIVAVAEEATTGDWSPQSSV